CRTAWPAPGPNGSTARPWPGRTCGWPAPGGRGAGRRHTSAGEEGLSTPGAPPATGRGPWRPEPPPAGVPVCVPGWAIGGIAVLRPLHLWLRRWPPTCPAVRRKPLGRHLPDSTCVNSSRAFRWPDRHVHGAVTLWQFVFLQL